jgi:hypothetical protein
MPNGRCKFHGGMSPRGPAHPSFKHGRHSKFLPKGLRKRYEEGAADPELVSVRAELSLLDLRVSELLVSIGKTGNKAVLLAIRGKLREFKNAGTKGEKAAVGIARLALQQLEDLIEGGLTAAATWDELRDTIDLRRKLAEAESRREKDMLQNISVQQAVVMMALLVKAVGEHVTDRNALNAIVSLFDRLTAGHGAAAHHVLGQRTE